MKMKNFRFGDFYVNKQGNLRTWCIIPGLNICISFLILLPIFVATLPLILYINCSDYFKEEEENEN